MSFDEKDRRSQSSSTSSRGISSSPKFTTAVPPSLPPTPPRMTPRHGRRSVRFADLEPEAAVVVHAARQHRSETVDSNFLGTQLGHSSPARTPPTPYSVAEIGASGEAGMDEGGTEVSSSSRLQSLAVLNAATPCSTHSDSFSIPGGNYGNGSNTSSVSASNAADYHAGEIKTQKDPVIQPLLCFSQGQPEPSTGQPDPSPGQPNGSGDAHEVGGEPHDEENGTSGRLRSPHHVAARLAECTSNPWTGTTVEPLHRAISLGGYSVKHDTSLAIVPYTGHHHLACRDVAGHQYEHRLYTLVSEEQRYFPFDSVARSLPFHVNIRGSEPPSDSVGQSVLPRQMNAEDNASTSGCTGVLAGRQVVPAGRLDDSRQEHRPEWVVMSSEQVEQAARKLREEADKNKQLLSTMKGHKRERVLIYDAAMKEATKREEEGVNEIKQNFEREQNVMRVEVDQELRKINDLYQERCSDNAQMVSEECEGEVTKASAALRKDWARQKKTIAQLVREGGEEDRQVTVIARAVMEQLQEEKEDELAAMRADVYSDVKMEFEDREVALRDSLRSEFQADLDGKLLLAEIRHQKDIDQLRAELSGGGPTSSEVAAGGMVVFTKIWDTPQSKKEGEGTSWSDPIPSTPSPLGSRAPLQQRARFGAERNGSGGSKGGAAILTGEPGVVRKFPAFKTPVRKVLPGGGSKTAGSSDRSSNNPKLKTRTRIRKFPRTPTVGVGTTSISPNAADPLPGGEEDSETDGSITSALMVSPTKALPRVVVTPSVEAEVAPGVGVNTVEPQRPKKKAKRLFSACP